MKSPQHKIPVNLKAQPYQVLIKDGGINSIGSELLEAGIKKRSKILVVTNPDIKNFYSETLIRSLKHSDYEADLLVLEAGEEQKTLRSIEKIHNAAYSTQLERSSLMIALGGGVIGDMTGFAASTWLRGISVIQVPTTLLAMVDASIGGKTGVNHPNGKNLIGSFHQPKLVLIDPSTLNTLPEREWRAGMAEVIKYGIIGDYELFSQLESLKSLKTISDIPKETLQNILIRSVSAKAKIVTLDEKEGGLRAILNYGHTFGHVVESLCGYGKWIHGEAVSIGMVAVGNLALNRNSWLKEDATRQRNLLIKTGLPVEWPNLEIKDVIKSLQGDKKVRDGNIRFIIPKRIGKVDIVDDISKQEIINTFNKSIKNLED